MTTEMIEAIGVYIVSPICITAGAVYFIYAYFRD